MTDVDSSAAHLQNLIPPKSAFVQEHGTISIDGDVLVGSGQLEHVQRATVARTDTAGKALFLLPAGAVITGLTVSSPAASDAGTSATLSIGILFGTGTEYLNALDVKGSTGSGQQVPTGGVLGVAGPAAVTVTGTYAESGSASSTGGPWTVICRYTSS